MANDGDLVKMENGRWARFQQMPVSAADGTDFQTLSILVAVELDEAWQARLRLEEEGGQLIDLDPAIGSLEKSSGDPIAVAPQLACL